MSRREKKVKVEHNIEEFAEFKELLRMKKPRSPHRVLFCTDDPEGWFIQCVEYKNKSGKVVHDDCINKNSMPGWVSWHKNLGWEEL